MSVLLLLLYLTLTSIIILTAKAEILTIEEFHGCVSVFGGQMPSNETYSVFRDHSRTMAGITVKLEALMALTHFGWESKGLTERSDPKCVLLAESQACKKYRLDPKCPLNITYYRRGYGGLRYCHNYRSVSMKLFGDERLVGSPEIAAENDSLAMKTALQFWKLRINGDFNVKLGRFGITTDLLSRVECLNDVQLAKARWIKFNECLSASGNGNLKRSEEGCYAVDASFGSHKEVNASSRLIVYAVASVAAFGVTVGLLVIFVRIVRSKSKTIEGVGRRVNSLYDDVSVKSAESDRADGVYEFAPYRDSTYEVMANCDRLKIKSIDAIYMPMTVRSDNVNSVRIYEND